MDNEKLYLPGTIPEGPCQCVGHPLAAKGCVCLPTERALRGWQSGAILVRMTPEQREWCLQEIGRVEGCDRADYENGSDAEVAAGVLTAWREYCRNKGLL